MNKPYWSGGRSRGGNTYADDQPDAGDQFDGGAPSYESPSYENSAYGGSSYGSSYGSSSYQRPSHESGSYAPPSYQSHASGDYDTGATDLLDYEGYPDSDDEDYAGYEYRDTRWRWIAGGAAAVLFIAVVAIATVLGNDSATSTSSTTEAATDTAEPVQDAAPSTAPRTVIATPGPGPGAELAPETVVTVTPTPSAVHPAPEPPPPPPPAEAPAPERTITYTVTGERQLFDVVTIIYTDEQGFPRTEINAALPWTRTVTLNPGVQTQSVTATSVTGKLNCAITDGTGATVLAQNNNTLITTCTK
ncbi:hypothetical protein MCHIJ_49500 [Mycolicibacterium chitae]|uniref:MmpS3 protein n=2 Tax=Mycolicibacterium chitae TaxID=1792 RepID=A0A3S5EIJ7_MYCCI|nr:hypothetical protein MCHIJ_49500 [Mycolicibacterium chitae]VEG49127.1 MmpS3 protein [Mycolicibacterium chitae]